MKIISCFALVVGTILWLDEGMGHRYIVPGVVAPNLIEVCMMAIVFVLSKRKTIIYVHPNHRGRGEPVEV